MNCMFEAYYQMIFCNKEGRCKNGIVSKHAILSIHQDSVERIGMKLSGVELAWNEYGQGFLQALKIQGKNLQTQGGAVMAG